MELILLFYLVDEFCKVFEPEWQRHLLTTGRAKRLKPGSLSLSEILTVIVHFHQSDHRTFKGYYTKYVCTQLTQDFPGLPSYNRFVELMSEALVPLYSLMTSLLGPATAANFVDSTTLRVCHNRRIRRHRVFKDLASRGKTSMGWFYGFKLHLNDILKNSQQIEHTRHRSPRNFVVNLMSGLIAYQLQPKKPSLDLPRDVIALLAA